MIADCSFWIPVVSSYCYNQSHAHIPLLFPSIQVHSNLVECLVHFEPRCCRTVILIHCIFPSLRGLQQRVYDCWLFGSQRTPVKSYCYKQTSWRNECSFDDIQWRFRIPCVNLQNFESATFRTTQGIFLIISFIQNIESSHHWISILPFPNTFLTWHQRKQNWQCVLYPHLALFFSSRAVLPPTIYDACSLQRN